MTCCIAKPMGRAKTYTLEQPAGTADDGGHVDLTDNANWVPLGDVKVWFLSQDSREFYREQQVQSNITHVAQCRYSARTSAIKPVHRLRNGSRVLQVFGAYNVGEANKWIRLRLVEKT